VVSIVVRPAHPDRRDAQAYAQYLNTAADGLFADLFGSDWRRVVEQLAMVPGHELSLENVAIAEVGGRIAGSCAGGQDMSIPVGLLIRALGWRVPRAALVWTAGFPTTAWMTRREPGDWYLQSIAVDADTRGTGVGSALFYDALERARAAGAVRMVLDVRVGNDAAKRLYERLGMRVIGRSPGPTLPGVHRVYRMGIDLT
jgi:ribosomal protein S18 acetylase RimI-like enzyme